MKEKPDKQKMVVYLKSWKKAGHKVTTWICPCCGKKNETAQPENSMVTLKGFWDSAKICYECGDLAFVRVYPSGKTKAFKLGG